MKSLFMQLRNDKFKINGKHRINMDLFISFIEVPLTRSINHLGSTFGWTQLVNNDHNLIIGGGFIDGIEYLDTIQYGNKLNNQFNNYVNPFFLLPIMNLEGKSFFIEFYKQDIENIIQKQRDVISHAELNLKIANSELDELMHELYKLTKG